MAAPQEQDVIAKLGRIYSQRLEVEKRLDAMRDKKREWGKRWAEAIGEAEKQLKSLDADARAVATGSLLPGMDITEHGARAS